MGTQLVSKWWGWDPHPGRLALESTPGKAQCAAGMLSGYPCQGPGQGQSVQCLSRRAPGTGCWSCGSLTLHGRVIPQPFPVWRKWGSAQREPLQSVCKLDEGVPFQCKSDEVTTFFKTLNGSLLPPELLSPLPPLLTLNFIIWPH